MCGSHRFDLGANVFAVNGDTTGGSNQVRHYGDIPWDESGPEAVYRLTTSSYRDIVMALDSAATDLDVFILHFLRPGQHGCLRRPVRHLRQRPSRDLRHRGGWSRRCGRFLYAQGGGNLPDASCAGEHHCSGKRRGRQFQSNLGMGQRGTGLHSPKGGLSDLRECDDNLQRDFKLFR